MLPGQRGWRVSHQTLIQTQGKAKPTGLLPPEPQILSSSKDQSQDWEVRMEVSSQPMTLRLPCIAMLGIVWQ